MASVCATKHGIVVQDTLKDLISISVVFGPINTEPQESNSDIDNLLKSLSYQELW